MHDAASTDKRHPTVNANGPIFGAPELSSDKLAVLDPVKNTAYEITVPLTDPNTPFATPQKNLAPSPYFGDNILWTSKTSPHSVMMDSQARVWVTSVGRPADNPAFCKEGSQNSSAKLYPLARSSRQVSFYDQKTKKFTVVDLCFSTLHLQFAADSDDTLWASSPGGLGAVGWLKTKQFDKTHDAATSQGWSATVLDTNGNGKRDDYAEPDAPVDPAKDKRINGGMYSLMENPADHSIWGTALGFRAAWCGSTLAPTRPQRRPPNIMRRRGTHRTTPYAAPCRAASISTAMAWCGPTSPATAVSPASIGANARGRSTGRKLRGNNALKAGPSTRCPGRNSKA